MIRTDRMTDWADTRLSDDQVAAVDDTLDAVPSESALTFLEQNFPPPRYRETQTGIRVRAASGLDYQGRYPQAADAATEVGADDDEQTHGFSWGWLLASITWPLVFVAVLAFFAVVFA